MNIFIIIIIPALIFISHARILLDNFYYIRHQKPKRHIRARTFQDCETTNIINSQVRNNTRAVVVEHSNTEQHKNSLFIRTAIDWNHLENSLVTAKTTEEFKGLLTTNGSPISN